MSQNTENPNACGQGILFTIYNSPAFLYNEKGHQDSTLRSAKYLLESKLANNTTSIFEINITARTHFQRRSTYKKINANDACCKDLAPEASVQSRTAGTKSHSKSGRVLGNEGERKMLKIKKTCFLSISRSVAYEPDC